MCEGQERWFWEAQRRQPCRAEPSGRDSPLRCSYPEYRCVGAMGHSGAQPTAQMLALASGHRLLGAVSSGPRLQAGAQVPSCPLVLAVAGTCGVRAIRSGAHGGPGHWQMLAPSSALPHAVLHSLTAPPVLPTEANPGPPSWSPQLASPALSSTLRGLLA